MLNIFASKDDKLIEITFEDAADQTLRDVIWFDMLNPTVDEEKLVEKLTGIDIPTRDEIVEIEPSSTMYIEQDVAYTTATLVTQSDTDSPSIHPVSFILTGRTLVTLRYSDPKAISIYQAKIKTGHISGIDGRHALVDLLEIIIGRCADALEKISFRTDDIAQQIFRRPVANDPSVTKPVDLKKILQDNGMAGDFTAKLRQSLVTLSRLITFIEQTTFYKGRHEELSRLIQMYRDISSLRDYAAFLSDKLMFLLDATLGMVNIEQNEIIKIFSVAAVIFLPPTLIASIYGMNFHNIPELSWHMGYPLALGAMVLSAYVPYRFFKKKGWLQ